MNINKQTSVYIYNNMLIVYFLICILHVNKHNQQTCVYKWSYRAIFVVIDDNDSIGLLPLVNRSCGCLGWSDSLTANRRGCRHGGGSMWIEPSKCVLN